MYIIIQSSELLSTLFSLSGIHAVQLVFEIAILIGHVIWRSASLASEADPWYSVSSKSYSSDGAKGRVCRTRSSNSCWSCRVTHLYMGWANVRSSISKNLKWQHLW
jgi:hypothetical protein